jgi:hypothetical protein
MQRECTTCTRPFAPADLDRAASRALEHDRKRAGLAGVRFLYYRCPACGTDDIFVDILPRDGEFAEDYERRREALEAAVRGLRAERVAAVVVPVCPP